MSEFVESLLHICVNPWNGSKSCQTSALVLSNLWFKSLIHFIKSFLWNKKGFAFSLWMAFHFQCLTNWWQIFFAITGADVWPITGSTRRTSRRSTKRDNNYLNYYPTDSCKTILLRLITMIITLMWLIAITTEWIITVRFVSMNPVFQLRPIVDIFFVVNMFFNLIFIFCSLLSKLMFFSKYFIEY